MYIFSLQYSKVSLIVAPDCRASSRIERNILGYRAINEWNTLSNSVVSSENINQFKTRLESFWETKEFKYDPSRFHDS